MMLFTRSKTIRVKRAKYLASFMLVTFLSEIVMPTALLALSGGPSQPEFSSFAQAEDQEMVDLFTGDFKYNIDLFEVGGYPITLNYNAGPSMEEEASWVGLGWNLNPGMISRNVRGIPDDCNGDTVTENYNLKNEIEIPIDAPLLLEVVGKETGSNGESGLAEGEDTKNDADTSGFFAKIKNKIKPSFGFDVVYNSYTGFIVSPKSSLGLKTAFGTASAGLDYSPSGGVNFVPSVKLGHAMAETDKAGKSLGAGMTLTYNSRNGLQNLGVSLGIAGSEEGEKQTFSQKISKGVTIPVRENTYFPYSKPVMEHTQKSFNIKTGADAAITDVDVSGKGSYAITRILEKEKSIQAYGYIYLQGANENALMDFNQEGDAGVFYPGQKHIMPSALTPDIFAVSAHGIEGSLRPYRNETGAHAESAFELRTSFSQTVGAEVAQGYTVKGGFDMATSKQTMKGGGWDLISMPYEGFDEPTENTLEENVVFRYGNELIPTYESYVDQLGGDKPVAYNLINETTPETLPIFPQRLQYDSTDQYQRRVKHQDVSILTAEQAKEAALDKMIMSFDTPGSLDDTTFIERDQGSHKPDHISQITCNDKSGNRYVFGIPAMNTYQKEYSMNTSGRPVDGDKTQFLSSDIENNKNGDDHYFYSKEIPAYAHSYLLSAWLGADYVDIKGDGVTKDDHGNAVRFNWRRAYNNYGWKTPVDYGMAYHMKGSLLSTEDEKGALTYGEKEIWHVHSLESKDQIAFFYTSDRDDAFGVTNELGQLATNALQKLDSIVIYPRRAYEIEGNQAEPLKKIEFEYGYTLCDGVPNSSSGKLTLKKLYISHGNSEKGKLSPYVFDYASNYSYAPTKVDRWGTYKGSNEKNLEFDIFPYVNEEIDSDSLDLWASAWNLSEIQLPSGAKINVEYESDEYGYVQDKKAQRMYHVLGMGSSPLFSTRNVLYDKANANSSLEQEYIYIENIGNYTSQHQLDKVLRDLPNGLMYFKFMVKLIGSGANFLTGGQNDHDHDVVRGYVKPLSIGFCEGTNNEKIWIKIDAADYNEKGDEINAIVKASMDYLYTSHQRRIFGSHTPGDGEVIKFVKNLIGIKDDLFALLFGPYGLMFNKGMAKTFKTKGSFVKLGHPTGNKKGGGHRVKRITTTDQWHEMTGSDNEFSGTYGKEYDYNYEDGSTSGVAQYEPSKGNDENPFKYPEYYKMGNAKSKKPKPSVFQEGPFGETFIPNPTVGYAQVTVTDINAENYKTAGLKSTYQFYTAKDFPIKIQHTDIEQEEDTKKPIWTFFGYGKVKRKTATSQGYSIVLNNMHGKPKSEKVEMVQSGYDKELVRSTEYIYQTSGKDLDHDVKCVNRYGEYTTQSMGVEAEVFIDTWEATQTSTNQNLQTNLSSFNVIIEVMVPPIWYANSGEDREYRTVVTTKIIQEQGILKKIVESNRKFKTTLTNEVWDSHTGEVVVTSRTTDYHTPDGRNDVLYSMKYPAYWSQGNDRMGHSYRNLGYKGKVGNEYTFLTQFQYLLLDDEDKTGLKSMIYRGLLDGLGDALYTSLKGNIVQGGVFAEGDEVYDPTSGNVYYAEEVLTYDDVTHILGLTGVGGTPPMSNGGGSTLPGSSGGGSGGSGGGGPYVPCGEVVLTDPTMVTLFEDLIEMCNQNSFNLASLPLTDNHATEIYNYLDAPTYGKWYEIWQNPQTENLFGLIGDMLDDETVQQFLAGIYDDPGSAQIYYNLYNCQPIFECALDQLNNTSLFLALGALFQKPERIHLGAAVAKHHLTHSVAMNLGINSINESYGETIGCHHNSELDVIHDVHGTYSEESQCGNVVDLGSYDYLFDLGYNAMQTLPDTANVSTCTYEGMDSTTVGAGVIDNSCIDVNQYTYDVLFMDCESYAEPNETAGGGSGEPGEDDDENNTPNHDYNMPQYDELVLFMDRDGNIVNLNGKTVQIIRSGRRNMLLATVGEEELLNIKPIVDENISPALVHKRLNASHSTYTDDWPSDFMPASNTDSKFNPFVFGQRGVFRPKGVYAAHTSRHYDKENLMSAKHGSLSEYEPFWEFKTDSNGTHYNRIVQNTTGDAQNYWLLTEDYLLYSGTGAQLESVNPLNIYSSMVAAKNNRLSAVAANSKHRNVMVEDFEAALMENGMQSGNGLIGWQDSEYKDFGSGSYDPITNPQRILTNNGAHTGEYAMMLRGLAPITGTDSLNDKPEYVKWNIDLETSGDVFDNELYRVSGFLPEVSREYILSAWMMSANTLRESPTYTGYTFDPLEPIGKLHIEFYDDNDNFISVHSLANITPEGESIDGWRRIEQNFLIPSDAVKMVLVFQGGKFGTLVDDIRIYPEQSSIQSYVYSGSDHKLKAMLDQNNYATFYKYEQDGSLAKLEKETETGRLTIKENRKNTAKNTAQ